LEGNEFLPVCQPCGAGLEVGSVSAILPLAEVETLGGIIVLRAIIKSQYQDFLQRKF